MESFIAQLEFWHWLTFAVLLIILEMLSPGIFMIWLGIAAGMVGIVMLAWPHINWQTQIILFAVFSVSSIAAWLWTRAFFYPSGSAPSKLNRRAEQYVGRTFSLVEPIVNGMGKIKVDDSTWKVHGKDAPAGTQVIVTDVDGTVLKVKPK